MFKQILLSLLLLGNIFSTIPIFQDARSSHYLLIHRNDNQILEEQGSQEKIYPASLTKMMVVYVALELIKDDQNTAILPESLLKTLNQQGAAVSFYPSEKPITYRDLLYGIALPSGADCAIVLSQALSQTTEAFVEKMNETAQKLKMNHTHFKNVTGLHHYDHYTTLSDLRLFLKVALQNKDFTKIFNTQQYTAQNGTTIQHTLFQAMQKTKQIIPGYEGSKTGFTFEAGHCLAMWFHVQDDQYLYLSVKGPGDVYSNSHLSDAYLVSQRLQQRNYLNLGKYSLLISRDKQPFSLNLYSKKTQLSFPFLKN